MEILLLLACAGVFFLAPAALAIVFSLTQQRSAAAPHPAAPPPRAYPPVAQTPVVAAEDADSRQAIVARLTQRFCPGCRAPLAADAPEGLCPACLMAGGLVGETSPPDGGMAATTPPSGSQPPAHGEWADLAQRFPQLEILELLGRGGMGTVYKVRQKNLDRVIALKVIPPDAAKDPAFAERFAREARAMARLNHPNIVTVYDFGNEGDLYWLMMEYVDGVNLRHTLRASRLAPREALAIVPQICDALQYAHDQGVVHRDIKPENVLLDRTGRVKIADFGLAKLLGKGPDDFTLTRTQQVMGTPRYMAPEQIERPAAVDHRADIYSLGVVLYEMLTGELPLGRFEPPSHKVELDVRIDQVVLRALEKAPERRYQRASQVKTELASAGSWPAPQSTPLVPEGPGARAHDVQAPTWHTPAPASKELPTDYPSYPGGQPLGMILAVAFGIVLGVLMIGFGLAAGVYAMTWGFHGFDGTFWGWMGGAFGCIVGGFGSAGGSYNSYRQMAGAEDLLRSPRTTWLDWVMWGYLLFGILLLASGLYLIDPVYTEQTGKALLTLGGIATFQAVLFVVLRRLLHGPAAPKPAVTTDPRREAIRRRVSGPAIGLMITGAMGLVPLLLALLAVPAWTVVPQMGPPREQGDSPWDQVSPPAAPLPPPAPLVPGLIPLTAVDPHVAPLLGFAALAPPLLLAQASGQPALWIFPFAAFLLVNLAFSILLIVGGWRMRQLHSYGLAVIAAVVAVLPCTFAWFLGLPIGIWALVVLLDPEVRSAFDS